MCCICPLFFCPPPPLFFGLRGLMKLETRLLEEEEGEEEGSDVRLSFLSSIRGERGGEYVDGCMDRGGWAGCLGWTKQGVKGQGCQMEQSWFQKRRYTAKLGGISQQEKKIRCRQQKQQKRQRMKWRKFAHLATLGTGFSGLSN